MIHQIATRLGYQKAPMLPIRHVGAGCYNLLCELNTVSPLPEHLLPEEGDSIGAILIKADEAITGSYFKRLPLKSMAKTPSGRPYKWNKLKTLYQWARIVSPAIQTFQ